MCECMSVLGRIKSGTRATGSYKLPGVGAENQVRVLCKSSAIELWTIALDPVLLILLFLNYNSVLNM